MELIVIEEGGVRALEGQPGEPLMARAQDGRDIIEACLSERVGAALLYAQNLPPAFFDLSSGVAGELLQKLENYHLRLAVVCPPGSVTLSSRFAELMAEEQRGRAFGLFSTRAAAWAWLAG